MVIWLYILNKTQLVVACVNGCVTVKSTKSSVCVILVWTGQNSEVYEILFKPLIFNGNVVNGAGLIRFVFTSQ